MMRAYVTIVDGDDALLPFFVKHYQWLGLGATEFPLLVYGTPEHQARARETIRRLTGVAPPELGLFESDVFSAKHREATIGRFHPAGEWAFFADLDEFAEMTPRFVHSVRNSDMPYLPGRWVDRVADGGKLAEVACDRSLEEQFPLAGSLRGHWRMGDLVYVMAPFAPRLHHPQVCKLGKPHWKRLTPARVHHFKWQTNVASRLRRRLDRIAAVGKSRTPWAERVRKMLAHLEEHQGIDPALLTHAGSVLGI